jgi:hypothetical protein
MTKEIIYNFIFNFIFKGMENKKCKSCKKTRLNKRETILLIIAGYIFVTSVYGTIHFIKHFFQT